MWDLFKAEIVRFRGWAIACASLHLVVLGFMTKMFDLAQQPSFVYEVIGMVYALTGLLLGMYQMGGYRRPNAWLNLLHRPLPHWRIAGALFGAGTTLLVLAILLPLLVVAAWQEGMTARVLDLRHLLLVLSALLVALCGYLAGGYTMLGHRRYGACAMVFLLLLAGNATGIGAIAVQLLFLVWLAVMILFAFKPDLTEPPRGVTGVVATAVPLQMGLWFLLLLAGYGAELVWIMLGSHPNSLATPVPGSTQEAESSDGKALMILGLADSTAAEAPLWREQAAISEVFTSWQGIEVPTRNELRNIEPMEFDDDTRRVRWVFSHDSMRFEGYSVTNLRSVGTLGVDGDAAFPAPAIPGPHGMLFAGNTLYQYDSEAQLVLPRMQLPEGELAAGFERMGERVAVLGNRALYFYDGRELQNGDAVLAPRQRVPLPGRIGNLERFDVMELLDGYLISFTFTDGAHNGDGVPFQQVLHVDGKGLTTVVAHRTLTHAGGAAYIYNSWYPSPVLYAAHKAVANLFAGYSFRADIERPPVPRTVWTIAGVLLLLSALGAAWYVRRTALSLPARIAWVVACGVIGLPALLSLWLMFPAREQLDDLPLVQVSVA